MGKEGVCQELAIYIGRDCIRAGEDRQWDAPSIRVRNLVRLACEVKDLVTAIQPPNGDDIFLLCRKELLNAGQETGFRDDLRCHGIVALVAGSEVVKASVRGDVQVGVVVPIAVPRRGDGIGHQIPWEPQSGDGRRNKGVEAMEGRIDQLRNAVHLAHGVDPVHEVAAGPAQSRLAGRSLEVSGHLVLLPQRLRLAHIYPVAL